MPKIKKAIFFIFMMMISFILSTKPLNANQRIERYIKENIYFSRYQPNNSILHTELIRHKATLQFQREVCEMESRIVKLNNILMFSPIEFKYLVLDYGIDILDLSEIKSIPNSYLEHLKWFSQERFRCLKPKVLILNSSIFDNVRKSILFDFHFYYIKIKGYLNNACIKYISTAKWNHIEIDINSEKESDYSYLKYLLCYGLKINIDKPLKDKETIFFNIFKSNVDTLIINGMNIIEGCSFKYLTNWKGMNLQISNCSIISKQASRYIKHWSGRSLYLSILQDIESSTLMNICSSDLNTLVLSGLGEITDNKATSLTFYTGEVLILENITKFSQYEDKIYGDNFKKYIHLEIRGLSLFDSRTVFFTDNWHCIYLAIENVEKYSNDSLRTF